jgi:uncharacterized protein YdhG (YjbR/CyaY superfamily)
VRAKETTVSKYLASLPADRRKEIAKVRGIVKKAIPKGYQETMGYGMITWSVPLSTYPDTYNKQPLMYVALAAQKNFNAIYLMCVYGDSARSKKFVEAFKQAGKKLDAGKSCVRFQRADDLELNAVADVISSWPMEEYVAYAKKVHAKRK